MSIVVSDTAVKVAGIQVVGAQQAVVAAISAATAGTLTDNSGGAADQTVAACGTAVTGVDGTGSNAASKADVDTRLTAIANNFADLTDEINKLIVDVADIRTKMGSLLTKIKAHGLIASA